MWVARNKDNSLSLFHNKPIFVYDEIWVEPDTKEFDVTDYGFPLDEDLFPELTWKDEPEEIELKMKNPLYKRACPQCGKWFKYHSSDIKEYRGNDWVESGRLIECPHCKKCIDV